MVYALLSEQERYRINSMSELDFVPFLASRRRQPEEYHPPLHISTSGPLNGDARKEIRNIELQLAEEAIKTGYEFVTNLKYFPGPKSMTIAGCALRKKPR